MRTIKTLVLTFLSVVAIGYMQVASADITCTCTKNDYGKWECELESTSEISREDMERMVEQNRKKFQEGLANGTIRDSKIIGPIREVIILEEKDIVDILEKVMNYEE